jgi:hypothetical protein
MPLWIVRMTVSTASAIVGNAQTAAEPHRHLGDDAERPFRADKKPGQIIAGRRFAGALRRADHLAVGQDDGQRQHILAHRPIAHRIRAGGARRRHAAE